LKPFFIKEEKKKKTLTASIADELEANNKSHPESKYGSS